MQTFYFWSHYLEMRYEVGRDAPLRLDPGATSLAVGLDFAIFTFKHNIKVIQNRHLRSWRHWSPAVPPLRSEINLRSRTIWVWGINITSPLIMSAGRSVYFPIPDHTSRRGERERERERERDVAASCADKRKNLIPSMSCVARTSEIGHDQTTEAAADVWKHQ